MRRCQTRRVCCHHGGESHFAEPDLRKLYHAYGPDFRNAEMNQYRNNFGHKHKDVIFFQDTDGVRSFSARTGTSWMAG